MNLFESVINSVKFQYINPLPQTRATFRALVEAVVPNTPELAEQKGPVQSHGALDLHIDDYLIWSLDHYLSIYMVIKDVNIHLANVIAELLIIAARQLVYLGGNKDPVNSEISPEDGEFAALSLGDRFRAITLLEKLKIDAASLPVPFRFKPKLLQSTTVSIILLPIIGYYTEWSGYGSTGMERPGNRRLEHFPTDWEQVGYPGPVRGYHAFRGYLVKKFKD